MTHWLERTELLLSPMVMEKLNRTHVLIVGLGGVGSFAAEFIGRLGVGKMTIIDGDVVDPTNKNRQLVALDSTVDKPKVDVLKERLLDINPHLDLRIKNQFIEPDQTEKLLQEAKPDYVIDCIDSVTPKIYLLYAARKLKIKAISCMGAGGVVNPLQVTASDISKTKNCKLARQIRKRLKKKGINKGIRAIYSPEDARKSSLKMTDNTNYKKSFYGTVSFMPAQFGLIAAYEVLRHIDPSIK